MHDTTVAEAFPKEEWDVNDAMVIATKQVVWWKANGFSHKTCRISLGLPLGGYETWDDTVEQMADMYERMLRR